MDRKGYYLQLIQDVLGHSTSNMTLLSVESWDKRIEAAFKTCHSNVRLPKFEIEASCDLNTKEIKNN